MALRARPAAAAMALALALGAPAVALAGPPLSLAQVLARAFPGAQLEPLDLFLSAPDREALSKAARVPVETGLATVYLARRAGVLVGRAVLDTRLVRTQTATVLVAVDPGGRVASIQVAAFGEPGEYLPTTRWLDRLVGRGSGSDLRPGHDLDAVSGATLSTRAFADSVRYALALAALAAAREDRPCASQ